MIDRKILKVGPFLRHAVKAWGFTKTTPVYTQIPIAPIICKNKNNIGFCWQTARRTHRGYWDMPRDR